MLMLMVSMLMVLMLMVSRLMARLIALMPMVLHDGANDANANGVNDANANDANDANGANTTPMLMLMPCILCVWTVCHSAGSRDTLGPLASTVQCCLGEGWFADVAKYRTQYL